MLDKSKKNIYLFYAIALLQGMVFYGPIATLYRQARGLSVFEITLIESISLVIMISLEIPWGYLSDKIGYRKTMVICSVLYCISKVVFWKAESFALFLVERLILSVVQAGISGCDSAYLYLSSEEKDRRKVFGIYDAMGSTGLIFASIVFSVVIRNNYGLAAFLTILSYGLAMLLALLLLEVKPSETKHEKFYDRIIAIIYSLSRDKRFLLFLAAAALLAESNQTITVFLNQLQYVRSGIPPVYMGYIYILVTLSGLLSAYSHKLTARLGETAATRLLFCLAGISCAIMAAFSNPVLSVLCIVFLRVSASLFVPVRMDVQNRRVTVSERATVLSMYSTVMNLMAVGTNLVFGRLADTGVQYAMTAGAVFCFSGLIIYMLWQKNNKFVANE